MFLEHHLYSLKAAKPQKTLPERPALSLKRCLIKENKAEPAVSLEFLNSSWLKLPPTLSSRKWAGMERLGIDSWPNYEPRIVFRKYPREVRTIQGVKPLVTLETI